MNVHSVSPTLDRAVVATATATAKATAKTKASATSAKGIKFPRGDLLDATCLKDKTGYDIVKYVLDIALAKVNPGGYHASFGYANKTKFLDSLRESMFKHEFGPFHG